MLDNSFHALRLFPLLLLVSTLANGQAPVLTAQGVIESSAGGFRFPDGSLQTTAAGTSEEGVINIDNAGIAAGTLSASDLPGFPGTLESGSYRLVENILVPDENTTALAGGNHISLDLNGFSIQGISDASGPAGTGKGISLGMNSHIKGGSVIGMGAEGVSVGSRSVVENVRVQLNQTGIKTGIYSRISRLSSIQNRNNGALIGGRSIVEFSIFNKNGGNGLEGDSTTRVIGNVAYNNSGTGIEVNDDCLVKDNVATNNTRFGLLMTTGSAYIGNIVNGNNGGDFELQVSDNGTGAIIELGPNVCGRDTSCP